ncbi:hypothetical protein HG560_01045 [Helicobacter pylori]|uniref:Hac prophage II protein n=1 Tax=Helicobacter pylori TaxID=210 RepID=A0AAE7PHS0_HELPX|nr:hypothetical protein [Helicobacter pylori]AFI00439.1 Hac prophage II protein [Helicobacter pylori Shi112]QQW93176.1 hypothetical protein HG560_01045 [Helicobacter pylori]QQX50544.1 hypothetical protein HG562_01050 [Helicobacter pylori]
MRQKRETETSFNQLKEITQSIQAHQALKTNQNANVSELTPKRAAQEPKRRAQGNCVLKPTKKTFSERQKTTIREPIQESANARTKTKEANQKGDNNAKA